VSFFCNSDTGVRDHTISWSITLTSQIRGHRISMMFWIYTESHYKIIKFAVRYIPLTSLLTAQTALPTKIKCCIWNTETRTKSGLAIAGVWAIAEVRATGQCSSNWGKRGVFAPKRPQAHVSVFKPRLSWQARRTAATAAYSSVAYNRNIVVRKSGGFGKIGGGSKGTLVGQASAY
jgi:hypothetical protein